MAVLEETTTAAAIEETVTVGDLIKFELFRFRCDSYSVYIRVFYMGDLIIFSKYFRYPNHLPKLNVYLLFPIQNSINLNTRDVKLCESNKMAKFKTRSY